MNLWKIFTITTLGILVNVTAFANPATNANTLPNLNTLPKPASFQPNLTPTPPNLNAKAYILIDANSGKVIAAKNPDEKLQPASLTKLMTLYIASSAIADGRIKLTDEVNVSKKAWETGGSRMFLKENQRVKVINLIHGIIVDSGNDACVALSQYIAGSETAFASLMNQAAKSLGMKNSHFVDSTGLPRPGHHATARDLGILARAIVRQFPQDYKWYSKKWFTFNGIRQPNRNRLLWWDPSVDGLKTGHTKEAGYCLIASAKRHGMRLISVVMGTPTDNARAADSQRLLNYGFRFFETHKLYDAGIPLLKPRVWKGASKHIPMGIANNFYVTIPTGQYKHLTAQIKINKTLTAPIQKGQSYGKIVVKLNNKPYATLPLIALQNDPKGGIWRRISDSIGLSFHRMFS